MLKKAEKPKLVKQTIGKPEASSSLNESLNKSANDNSKLIKPESKPTTVNNENSAPNTSESQGTALKLFKKSGAIKTESKAEAKPTSKIVTTS